MKRFIILLFLIALIKETKAQANAISDEINKIADTNQVAVHTLEKGFTRNDSLLRGWSISCNFGITQFRGDIQEGDNKLSSNSTIFNLNLHKKIDQGTSLMVSLSKGSLNGKRYDNSYKSSQTIEEIYNPYDGYAGFGEQFESDFIIGSFICKLDVEQLIMKHNAKYVENKSFSLFYNMGIGIIMFRSLKTNIGSNSYIYGYGYEDPEEATLMGDYYFWETPDQSDQAKEGIIIYGPTITYHLNDRAKIDFSSLITSLTQSDFLDASEMSSQPQKDRFRTVSIGLRYSIN